RRRAGTTVAAVDPATSRGALVAASRTCVSGTLARTRRVDRALRKTRAGHPSHPPCESTRGAATCFRVRAAGRPEPSASARAASRRLRPCRVVEARTMARARRGLRHDDDALLAAAGLGDRRARDQLVVRHLDLVRAIASLYRDLGLPLDDLAQEG